MNTEEIRDLALLARQKLQEIEAADTLTNERRLTELLATRGIQLRRGRNKGPSRYTIRLAGGDQIVGVTLADVESLVTSWDQRSAQV